MYVLGVDSGGSKTVALLADGAGQVVAEARGGGANLQVHGELEVEKTLHGVIDEVLSAHHVTPAAACVGIAGVDRERDGQTIRHVMRRLGFRDHTLIVNDALIALVAGGGIGPGLVLVSGTGSIAYGVSPDGVAARAGGWGSALGDEGSAYWIGRRALAAVTRDADGRGPATRLTALVLERMSLSRPQQLIAVIYESRHDPRTIAELASTVERARSEGDVVATEILRDAASELVLAASSVVTRLSMRGAQFPTFLSGGMLRSVPWLAAEVTRRLAEVAPRSRVSALEVEPALGAVRLALAEAEGRAKVPRYLGTVGSAVLVTVLRFEEPAEVASALAADLISRIQQSPTLVLGLATGRTPMRLYRELRERTARADVDWSRIRTFNLDEFVGPGHIGGRYRSFMTQELFDHVNLRADHIEFLDGRVADLEAECDRYERAIEEAGGIDVQILGIGVNGHIGFNEPAPVLHDRTHVARLELATRERNAWLFDRDIERVPELALSMGIATILDAREIVLVATGSEKAEAVRGMIEGPPTPSLPASLLERHAAATAMIDGAAAVQLSR